MSKPNTRKPAAKRRASKKPRRKPSTSSRGSIFWYVLRWAIIIGVILGAALFIYLDHVVVEKFSGKKWSVPARVYARPLELYEGLVINPQHVYNEALALGYEDGKTGPGSISKKGNTIHLHTRGFEFIDGVEPARNLHLSFNGNTLSSIRSASGADIPVLRMEPMIIGGIYPDHNEDRILVRLDEVPAGLTETLIAVEDRNYYQHWGVSIRGIARAIIANIRSQKLEQGGSTLTQQLVKNFFLTSERTLSRKAIEACMALILEFRFSKEEILEAYLNEIYLGQNGNKAIHGFGLASYYYFNKPLDALEMSEYALLVGIVRGPSYYDPKRKPERALERRNTVLDVLHKQGVIDDEKLAQEKAKPINLSDQNLGLRRVYPAFLDLVHRQLKRDYQETDLETEGLKIFTSFDPFIQWSSEKALSARIDDMEKRLKKESRESLQAAIVVTDPQTGEVNALIGDKKIQFVGFNRALDAQRPIGSLIKPAVYLAALNQSERFTLASVLSDRAIEMQSGGKLWAPQNFDKREHGDVMLYRALAKSYNLATVRLGLDVGVPKVVDTLRALGVSGDIPAVPSLLLGALDMSPFDVAQMYQTIAGDGFYTPLRAIRDVTDAENNVLKRYPYKVEKRFDSDVMYLLQFAMHEVVRAGTARAVYASIPRSIELAGKTGTSNDQRDSWFAGFSANRLAVVWIGRDDNKPMPFSGSSGALPIWTAFMKNIELRSLQLREPANVQTYWVDAGNGGLTQKHCMEAIALPFIIGSEPKEMSSCVQEEEFLNLIEAEDKALRNDVLGKGKRVIDWISDML